jgi:sarcosine oxidase subunit alpha
LKNGDIVGRITSASYSETLKKTIGLAYVAPEQAAVDTLFDIKVGGGRIVKGRVTRLPFYDAANARQEM